MPRFVAVLFALSCFLHVNAFVLNKVDKEMNPADAMDNESKDKPYTSLYAPEKKEAGKHVAKSSKQLADHSLEKVVWALKNGIKNVLKKNNVKADFVDKYAKKVIEYIKSSTGPLFRAASEKYDIKPEVIHFRSDGDKPTLKIEINPSTISKVISDLVTSDAFVRHFDNVVQQVAIVYRTLKD